MRFKTFDAAKWSTSDILTKIIEMNIKINTEDLPLFIENVVNTLESNFDASIGINWGTIENAIQEVSNEQTRA